MFVVFVVDGSFLVVVGGGGLVDYVDGDYG